MGLIWFWNKGWALGVRAEKELEMKFVAKRDGSEVEAFSGPAVSTRNPTPIG
jgi:hypothetical protein